MDINQTDFNQISKTLARHFDSMYYVEIESGKYTEFMPSRLLEHINIPKHGDDFFAYSRANAHKVVHPDDLEMELKIHEKDVVLKNLSKNNSYTVGGRLVIDGKIIHMRHINIMCEDKKHIICCMENVEEEYQEKERQKKNLQSAERQARRDELTGIKNQNAFAEESSLIDEKIKSQEITSFGIVMCDINDLKRINDTRGHSFGDEAIQRASRMICDIYKHSPVFRIGGDEFVVILSGNDYDNRMSLLESLKEESEANDRSRSGPIVACGMAVYEPDKDNDFSAVFERADVHMYENKNKIKSGKVMEGFKKMDGLDVPIPADRKRLLDGMFGAMLTIAGDGYVYLNDMKYDFSRWSLSLIDDFGLKSEYMYHADKIWQDYVHPDDIKVYREAVDAALCGNAEVRLIYYRARKADGTYVTLRNRGFVLSDREGKPEYFGGIIIPQ